MAINMNNHVFKGHKTLLGHKYVTYAELELPLRYDIFSSSKNFDWGYNGSASIQLAFSILFQLSDEEFAKEYATKFANEVIRTLSSRDWLLSAIDVSLWIKNNTPKKEEPKADVQSAKAHKSVNSIAGITKKPKAKKPKTNVVKQICKELNITQKHLAEILEVPEGTVSSWAVKNEIPRLGKKAIEFYMLNSRNQKIVDSYRNFVDLMQAS